MAAKKRTEAQILRDRKRIAELKLQKHTHAEIADILHQESGIRMSPRMISYDMNRIRKAWREGALESYNELMMQELSRIDALESSLWQALRDSTGTKKKEVIDRVVKEVAGASDDEVGLVITKVQETLEDLNPNPAYFSQILSCQQERRKLLGLYAPQQIGVEKTVIVKGYAEVSPDNWPDIVEGEIVE